MNFLNQITPANFKEIPLPMQEIISDSAYYPAAGKDWGFIREVNGFGSEGKINSFIYSDYCIGREKILEKLDFIECYNLLATRELNLKDVVPNETDVSNLPWFNKVEYYKHANKYQPFAQWSIYQRNEDFDDNIGPARLSLLYLGTEGVKAYKAIYAKNNLTPKILALIQPGEGFGGGYTGFADLLREAVYFNTEDTLPEKVYFGGALNDSKQYNLNWPGYKFDRSITGYYWGEEQDGGTVNVYSRT